MSRGCAICSRPDHDSINAAIQAGKSDIAVAEMFKPGLTRHSVGRHKRNGHVPNTPIATTTPVADQNSTDDPVAIMKGIITRLNAVDLSKISVPAAMQVTRELRIAAEKLAQIAPPPVAAVNSISQLEDFNDFARLTFKALEPHPDARRDLDAAWARWYAGEEADAIISSL